MIDYIITAVIAVVLGAALWYVVKAKKNGKKCIGCPDGCCGSKQDGSSCSGCCNNVKNGL